MRVRLDVEHAGVLGIWNARDRQQANQAAGNGDQRRSRGRYQRGWAPGRGAHRAGLRAAAWEGAELLLLNDGQGHFTPQHHTGLLTNDCYEAAAADLNLDGYTDIVLAEQYETQGEIGESHIFWGGKNGFSQDQNTGVMTHSTLGVSVADLNRDGYLDILFGQMDRLRSPLSGVRRW